LGEQLIYKLACRYGEHALAYRQLAARTAGLPTGTAAPRLLVRVDEFPHAQAWDEPERLARHGSERFHEIMAGTGVPYLIAVLPRVSRAPCRLLHRLPSVAGR